MTDFVLKTETERQMYVEALFHCLDHGTLTEHEVLEDLCDLIPGLGAASADDSARVEFIRQTQRIVAGYKAGLQDRETAAARLLRLFNNPVTAGGAPSSAELRSATA